MLWAQGDPADFWWVLLEGAIDLLRRVGTRSRSSAQSTVPGTWAGGFRAWADSAPYLATGRGAGAGRVLRAPGPALGELVSSWFPFGVHLIDGLFQHRAQHRGDLRASASRSSPSARSPPGSRTSSTTRRPRPARAVEALEATSERAAGRR